MVVFDQDNVLKANKQRTQQDEQENQFWEQPFKKNNVNLPDQVLLQSEVTDALNSKTFLKGLDQNCMALCRELTETNAYNQMVLYGSKYPQCSLIGYFLRLLGNVLLRHVKAVKNRLLLKHNKEVIGIRLQTDGWFSLRVQNHKDEDDIKQDPKSQTQTTATGAVASSYQTIRAKSVILCIGRTQDSIPPNLILNNAQLKINSESFFQEDGLIKVFRHINNSKPKGTTKVVIYGGGQSAFLCADLLLNGPVTYRFDESQLIKTGFVQKRLNCEFSYLKQRPGNSKISNQYSKEPTNIMEDPNSFGNLRPKNFKWQTTDVVTPDFGKNDILIVSEEQISLYFQNETEAINSQYIPMKEQVGEQGEIGSLTGLRARAKELYMKIQRGQESRISIASLSEVKNTSLVRESLVIIESRGLKSQSIPIRDTDGNLIQPIVINNHFSVTQSLQNILFFNKQLDQFGRIRTEKGSVRNLFSYGTCGVPNNLLQRCSKPDKTSKQEISTGFQENCKIEYLSRGLKIIEETFRHSDQTLSTQGWFDQNEFPRTGQSSAFLSKGDFDSDGHRYISQIKPQIPFISVHSDMVENETLGLNSLDQLLKQEKKRISFDKVEKLYQKKR